MQARERTRVSPSAQQAPARAPSRADKFAVGKLVVGPELSRSSSSPAQAGPSARSSAPDPSALPPGAPTTVDQRRDHVWTAQVLADSPSQAPPPLTSSHLAPGDPAHVAHWQESAYPPYPPPPPGWGPDGYLNSADLGGAPAGRGLGFGRGGLDSALPGRQLEPSHVWDSYPGEALNPASGGLPAEVRSNHSGHPSGGAYGAAYSSEMHYQGYAGWQDSGQKLYSPEMAPAGAHTAQSHAMPPSTAGGVGGGAGGGPYSYSMGAPSRSLGDLREAESSGSGGFDRSSSGSGTMSPEPPVTVGGGQGEHVSRDDSFEIPSEQSVKKGAVESKEKVETPIRWGAIALGHMDTFISRSTSVDGRPRGRNFQPGMQRKPAADAPLTSVQLLKEPSPSESSPGGAEVSEKDAGASPSSGVQLESPVTLKRGNTPSPGAGQNGVSEEKNVISQTRFPAKSASEGSQISTADGDAESNLLRRNSSDMAAVKSSMQSLQLSVQGIAFSVKQLATAQQVPVQTECSGSHGLEELQKAVAELSAGLHAGLAQLGALIQHKDAQQQARLMNLATVYEGDSLVPLPSDSGIIPESFPATRKDFLDLSPEALAPLLQHYGLQLDPPESRLELLGRFIGLRW